MLDDEFGPHPGEVACNRCATLIDLQGQSKNQARKSGLITRSDWHDTNDCLRTLVRHISFIQENLMQDGTKLPTLTIDRSSTDGQG